MKSIRQPGRLARRRLRLTLQAGLAAWVIVYLTVSVISAGLDQTFGTGGRVTTDFGGGHDDVAHALVLQPDGKIVAAGSSGPQYGPGNFALARYNANGSPDTTFDGDGRVTTDYGGSEFVRALARQADGKIVAAGGAGGNFALARYNANGSPDTTFDGDGKLTTDFGSDDVANALVVQPDGKIVVAGGSGPQYSSRNFALARYNANGTLDATFDGDGKLTTDFGADDYANALVRQADGKLVAAGYGNNSLALARYNANGAPDSTFDGDGKATSAAAGAANSLVLQADGKLVTAGGVYEYGNGGDNFSLARFNANGSPDSTFDGDGRVTADFGGDDVARALIVQADGKLVAAGVRGFSSNSSFALARYNASGSLDAAFGIGGRKTFNFSDEGSDAANALALQADGKLVAAGVSRVEFSPGDFALARYGDGVTETPPYSISGRVRSTGGNALNGVTVQLGGDASRTATTNGNGFYKFDDLAPGGSYTLTASLTLSTGQLVGFDPQEISISNLSQSVSNQDFVAISPVVTIAGVVTDQNGDPVEGITVQTCVPINGSPGSCAYQTGVTNGAGAYTLSGLTVMNGYNVEPKGSQFVFDPSGHFFNELESDVLGADFRAIPAPSITALSPANALAGSPGFTLTVNGTNFNENSVVQWNGSDRTTAFASPTQLTAEIPAADVATPGTASVAVSSILPGFIFHTSNAVTFNVTALLRTLTVASVNPASGVLVSVRPADNSGQGNGHTQFTRAYNNNTQVTLTASGATAGRNFQKWQRDGADYAATPTVNVTMGANYTMTAVYISSGLRLDSVAPRAGRAAGGQQIVLSGQFAGLSSVTLGGANAAWSYTNGAGDTTRVTVTTPAHAAGAVGIDLAFGPGETISAANAFAYLPTAFTDDTLLAGVTTAKAQHITELRQAVDALRAVTGLAPAQWTDPVLLGLFVRSVHVAELRARLEEAAAALGLPAVQYADPGLGGGGVVKRVHIEELRQRVRNIAG